MSTLQQRALSEMWKLVGILESGGNNRGASVERIQHAVGGRTGDAWCGWTVAYAYQQAGCTTVNQFWGSVANYGHINGQHVLGHKCRGGDPVVYTFDHVGAVVTFADKHGHPCNWRKAHHVVAIEGNTGTIGALSDSANGHDGVRVKLRSLELVDRFVRVER